jgi:hypothetical protein
MISNLPIISGDKIKLVFLQKGYNDNDVIGQSGYAYSTGILCPAFLPITGEYNDYGNIENIEEDWNYEKIESTLKEKFGDVIFVEKDNEIKDWKLTDLIDGIERSGSYTPQPKYHSSKQSKRLDCDLSFVMIRQDVWDLCVEMQSKNEDYWNPDRTKDKDLPYQINGENFGNRIFGLFIESIKKVFDDPMEQMRHDIMSEHTLRYVFTSNGESRLLMADYKNMCRKRKDDDDFLLDIKKRWYEQIMVEDCLSNLRIL